MRPKIKETPSQNALVLKEKLGLLPVFATETERVEILGNLVLLPDNETVLKPFKEDITYYIRSFEAYTCVAKTLKGGKAKEKTNTQHANPKRIT